MSQFARFLLALLAVAAASLGTAWLVLNRAVDRAAQAERAARAAEIARRIGEALEREPDLGPVVARWADTVSQAVAAAGLRAAADATAAAARDAGLDGWLVVGLGTDGRLAGGALAPRSLPPGGVGEGDTWWDERGGTLVRCAASLRRTPAAGGGTRLALVGCREIAPGELAGAIRRRHAGDVAQVSVSIRSPGRAPGTVAPGRIVVPVRGRRGTVAEVEAELASPAGEASFADRLRTALWGGLAAGALVALGLAGLLAAGTSAPLRRLARAVDGITERGLEPTPMPRAGGEAGRLARAIDRMIATVHQERLRRRDAERRAAWREVARRVAHEVRNPLTPIRLAVDNLRRAASRGPDALDAVLAEETDAIREEVARLERLVREFADYARLPAPDPRPVDLAALARRAIAGQIPEDGRVRLELDGGDALPPVLADPDLLAQALANLARNAVSAFGERGGTIRVTLGASAGEVTLRIADDGPGIPPELAGRVFEPYVSGGGGSGLGLAICRRIVEEHGGTIIAESPPEGGTAFVVGLPAAKS
ncbi:MAG: hypothetical protein Kow0062_22720 [Acidobacteriota bacterium]